MSARQKIESKEQSELPSERRRAVWIRTWTAAPSGPRKIQFRAFDNPADPWKNIVDGKVVHFGGHAARRIFGKNDGIAVFPCLSCRRLDADICRDAPKDECLDTEAA